MLKGNFTGPVASFLGEKVGLSAEEEDVVRYGLQLVVYGSCGFITILLAGWILGCMATTLEAALVMAVMRSFSGGAHSRSPVICTIVGMISASLMGLAALKVSPLLSWISLLLIVLGGFVPCFGLILFLAPVDCAANPIRSTRHRRDLRRRAILALFLLTAGQVTLTGLQIGLQAVLAMSLGLWWQTFSLTHAGHWFAAAVDNLFLRGGEIMKRFFYRLMPLICSLMAVVAASKITPNCWCLWHQPEVPASLRK